MTTALRGVVSLCIVVVVVGSVTLPATSTPAATQEGQRLQPLWTSDPPAGLASNHHTPAATYFQGDAYVAVPLNDRHGNTCILSVLDGNGTVRWRDTIADDQCTVHAVSDPTIADYDTDGQPEVLAATSEQVLVAYDLQTGEEELRYNLTSYGYSRPLVANLTPTPGPETVVVDLLGGVFVLRPNGSAVWTRKLGDARVRQPAVRDFDADGTPELAVGQLSGPVTLLESDGSVAWRTNISDSVAVRWMTNGQLDGDDAIELVVATFTGHVVAIDGATGRVEWDRDLGAAGGASFASGSTAGVGLHGVKGAAVRAVGDGDGDGQVEVYPVARDGRLYSLNGSNGAVEWTTRLTSENVSLAPPPSLGDVTGDGQPELVIGTETGRLAVVDPATGRVMASYDQKQPIRTFPRLADVTGDGTPEMIVIYGDGRVTVYTHETSGSHRSFAGCSASCSPNRPIRDPYQSSLFHQAPTSA